MLLPWQEIHYLGIYKLTRIIIQKGIRKRRYVFLAKIVTCTWGPQQGAMPVLFHFPFLIFGSVALLSKLRPCKSLCTHPLLCAHCFSLHLIAFNFPDCSEGCVGMGAVQVKVVNWRLRAKKQRMAQAFTVLSTSES